jgi:hypothetical protein
MEVIFVADMFAENYSGGAELTTESLIESSSHLVRKVLSSDLEISYVKSNADKFWIFGNFTSVREDVRHHFIKHEKYVVLEYDYKFCKYRNPTLHKSVEGSCHCEKSLSGKLNSIFLHKSKAIFWMSKSQRDIYLSKFPFMKKSNNIILSSIFGTENLNKICKMDTSRKNNKWIILNSPSVMKNTKGAIEYARQNNLEYELVWQLKYEELLKKLSKSKGLIFLPSGEDTCPRLVIESKLLDCEVVMNENVQQRNETWFQNKTSMIEYLKSRPKVFWDEVNKVVKDV